MDNQDSDPETEGSNTTSTWDQFKSNIVIFGCLLLIVCTVIACVLGLILVVNIVHSSPNDIKIAVTGASLTDEFNITKSSNYGLDLNISLRNPSRHYRINYDKALVVAVCRNTSAMASIADFQQPPKNTTLVTTSLKLQRDNITDDDAAGSGKVNHSDILVRLVLPMITFRSVTWWKAVNKEIRSLIFTCDLRQVPLQNGSHSAPAVFNSTKCHSTNSSYNRRSGRYR